MLTFQVTGQRPRALPHWRVSLSGVRQQQGRIRDSLLLDAGGRMHAFDEMLHWQGPEQRLLTLRRRRPTLIDDNPCSG